MEERPEPGGHAGSTSQAPERGRPGLVGACGPGGGAPRLRAPQSGSRARALQELPNQASHWSARLLARLGIPNVLQEDVPDVPPEYYTCEFKVSKLSR